MAQQPLSLTDVIETLAPSEEGELAKLLQNPILRKYFRIMGMTAVFEQAAIPYNTLSDKEGIPFLIEMAYQKGIASMADTVLTFTPTKEPSNGTSAT